MGWFAKGESAGVSGSTCPMCRVHVAKRRLERQRLS
jgi:hypothetical protein